MDFPRHSIQPVINITHNSDTIELIFKLEYYRIWSPVRPQLRQFDYSIIIPPLHHIYIFNFPYRSRTGPAIITTRKDMITRRLQGLKLVRLQHYHCTIASYIFISSLFPSFPSPPLRGQLLLELVRNCLGKYIDNVIYRNTRNTIKNIYLRLEITKMCV